MHKLDFCDISILEILQSNADAAVKDIAEKVGLSHNACWRRIRSLEENGVIMRRVVLLDPDMLGLRLTAFVHVEAAEHSVEWNDAFRDAVLSMPEVIDFYKLAGDIDYIIKLILKDIAHYKSFYDRLIQNVRLTKVSASFAISEFRNKTAIPLPYPRPADGAGADTVDK